MTSNKQQIRIDYKNIRKKISVKRRKEAEELAFNILYSKSAPHKNILSFAPINDEINIWKYNKHISKEKNLYFPKLLNSHLEFFLVKDIENDLSQSSVFSLIEPIVSKYSSLQNLDDISLAIIPGLAFDKMNMRIGYGKGYYDKFLVNLKNAYKIAVGFKEQFFDGLLPADKYDICLDEVILV